MPSPMTIKVRCKPHLVAFMESIYGPQPIEFPRKDNFSLLLNYLVDKETENNPEVDPADCDLVMLLPYFEDKNVLYNFTLTARKQEIFVTKIEDKFRITFRDEINQCALLGIPRHKSIYLFMEKYGLSEDSIDMLAKDYQRYRNLRIKIRTNKRRKKASVK